MHFFQFDKIKKTNYILFFVKIRKNVNLGRIAFHVTDFFIYIL